MSLTLLESLRLDAGLTRDDLAEKAGVNVRTIRNLEHDPPVRPRLTTLGPIAKVLDVKTSVLMEDFITRRDRAAA